MSKLLVTGSGRSVPVHAVAKADYPAWKKKQPKTAQRWLEAVEFAPKGGRFEVVPDGKGDIAAVVVSAEDLTSPWTFAGLTSRLPAGRYSIATKLDAAESTNACVGWLLGGYQFRKYRKPPTTPKAQLVVPRGADAKRAELVAESISFARDLINTPAEDMGPSELSRAARSMAARHGAKTKVLKGNELLRKNYPTIYTVGRASDDPAHLIDIRWGRASDPKVTLVGKGVCFDSGGLDLKPSSSMLTMKKDMGGAAAVLAIANMVMGSKLRVRLRVLIPAVENSVAGNAFRPLDVIRTRKGLTVEIGNTDAEGRLVLCDALAEACTESPEVLIDMATLTGAARVALGTDLPALFANDDNLANAILDAGTATRDRLWRMPLHTDYRKSLDSSVADINNAGNSSYGGAITAALFLREFVDEKVPWAHIDTMAWNVEGRPGRPSGGEAMAARAIFAALEARFAKKPKRASRR